VLSPTLQNALVWQQPDATGSHVGFITETVDGRFQVLAAVEVTASLPPEKQAAFYCRLGCIMLAARLDDGDVVSAYETMSEMYKWHQEKHRYIPREPERGVLTLSSVSPRERHPFVVDNER